jgi:hypothetical protein
MEDKWAYHREYQRVRYQADPEFRQKAIDRSRNARCKHKKQQLVNCILAKLLQGPKPPDYLIHIPKKRGRPIQIDENGIRYFKPHKLRNIQINT